MKVKVLFNTIICILLMSVNQFAVANSTKAFNEAFTQYNALINEGQFQDALLYAKKSYQLAKEQFDPQDKNRLTATDNYALNLKMVKKPVLARIIFLELLTLSENKYGKHAKELLPLLADINDLNKTLADTLTDKVDAKEAKNLAIRQYKLYLRHYSDEVVDKFVDEKLPTTIHAKNTLKKVTKHLDKEFAIYETKHWSIIYPVEHLKFVKKKMAKTMEHTYRNNLSFLVSLGLRNKPIEEKMTAVYLGSKEDYRSYVATITGDSYAASNSGSIYSSKARSIFMFARGFNKKGKFKHVRARSVIHIVTDQVFAATGFKSPHVVYPRWYTKGLAVSFEPHDRKQSFGPHTNNYAFKRLFEIKKSLENRSLISLEQLITLDGDDEAFQNEANQKDVYMLGHVLVRFLYAYYPDELKEYLSIIAKSRTVKYERAKFGKNIRLKQFTKAFGHPENIQDKFNFFADKIIEEAEILHEQYKKRKAAKK